MIGTNAMIIPGKVTKIMGMPASAKNEVGRIIRV